MLKEQATIAIIGGGIAGLSVAFALSRLPFKVSLFESRPWKLEFSDARFLAISQGSRLWLEYLKIWECFGAVCEPIELVHVSEQGHLGALRFSAKEAGVEALGYVMSLSALVQGLSEALRKTSVALHFSTQVGLEDIQADLIVCADGAASTLSKSLGIQLIEKSYDQTAILAQVGLKQSHSAAAYQRFRPEGPLAFLPIGPAKTNSIWTVPTARVSEWMSLSDSSYLSALQAAFGYRLGLFSSLGPRQAFPLNLGYVTSVASARAVILGNAAHQLHPVAAQGFNLTVRDIVSIYKLLSQACPLAELPQCYQAARKQDHQRLQHFTDDLVYLFSNETWPLTPLRTWGLTLAERWPCLKKYLSKRLMGCVHV